MQPTMIGGGTVEVTVLVGAETQMLRLLQICPFLQSALVMQPTLMGAAELDGAGGGAATQMLWSPQICPLAQSALVMHPSLTGAEETGAGALLAGAATQMLRRQTCPLEQSALTSQPSLMGGADETGAGAEDGL
jgi:hypothetical protein